MTVEFWSAVAALATFVAALAAAATSYTAFRHIKMMKDNIQLQRQAMEAQLLMVLMQEYSSSDFLEAMECVKHARESQSNYPQFFGRMRRENRALVKDVDHHRRRVSHWFRGYGSSVPSTYYRRRPLQLL